MKKIIFTLSLLSIFLMTTEARTKVLISTNKGDITIELYDETPKHRDNFVKLVNEGTYEGLLFHRVIKDFMIQAGDPQSKNAKPGTMLGAGDVGYQIDAEFNSSFIHKKGALAAARTGDAVNPQKKSSGCQFYIVVGTKVSPEQIAQLEPRLGLKYTEEQKKIYAEQGGTPFLDGQYTVFGEVVEGLNIVDTIAVVKTASQDRPVEDVVITSMKVL